MTELDMKELERLSHEQLRRLLAVYHAAMVELVAINNQFSEYQEDGNKTWAARVNVRLQQMATEANAVEQSEREAPPPTQLN